MSNIRSSGTYVIQLIAEKRQLTIIRRHPLAYRSSWVRPDLAAGFIEDAHDDTGAPVVVQLSRSRLWDDDRRLLGPTLSAAIDKLGEDSDGRTVVSLTQAQLEALGRVWAPYRRKVLTQPLLAQPDHAASHRFEASVGRGGLDSGDQRGPASTWEPVTGRDERGAWTVVDGLALPRAGTTVNDEVSLPLDFANEAGVEPRVTWEYSPSSREIRIFAAMTRPASDSGLSLLVGTDVTVDWTVLSETEEAELTCRLHITDPQDVTGIRFRTLRSSRGN